MNELVISQNKELTMSSREIADLVEKRHDNVKRTIETLAKQGVIIHPQIEDEQILDALGRARAEKVYRLVKRDTYVVVAQLSPEFTARLVDRWQELEEQNKFLIPQTLPDALRLAADLADQNKLLQQEVSEMMPQVNALKRISASDTTLTMTQASKVLGEKLSVLTTRLHAEGWVYRQNESWVAYDRYIKNGCLVYKEATYTDEKTGLKVIKPYCHVTQKGMTKLAEIFNKEDILV